jgi:hypothetical protein
MKFVLFVGLSLLCLANAQTEVEEQGNDLIIARLHSTFENATRNLTALLGYNLGDSVCTTTNLNIRSSPDTSASILFTANAGEQLSVSSTQTFTSNGLEWLQLKGRGYVGYAASKYLKACSGGGGGGGGSAAAPCFSDRSSPRDKLMITAWALYNQRANGHYSQDMVKRWVGISGGVCAPAAPVYSDCSSSSTWVYWSVFGRETDFLNGQSWSAGYTGTLSQHGRLIDLSAAKPGDLVFYGKAVGSISHVSIYAGKKDGVDMTISHGSDPVGYYPIDAYGSLKRLQIRTYLDGRE